MDTQSESGLNELKNRTPALIIIASLVISLIVASIANIISYQVFLPFHEQSKALYGSQMEKFLTDHLHEEKYWQNISKALPEPETQEDLIGFMVGNANGATQMTRFLSNQLIYPMYKYLEDYIANDNDKVRNTKLQHPKYETKIIGEAMYALFSLQKHEKAPIRGYIVMVWNLEKPKIIARKIALSTFLCSLFSLLTGGFLLYFRIRKGFIHEINQLSNNLQLTAEELKILSIKKIVEPIKHEQIENIEEKEDTASANEKVRKTYQFLEMLTSEMRMPIQAIIGFCTLLSKNLTEGQNVKYLEKINVSTLVLMDTVNDLRDLSAIENKSFKLKEQNFDPREQYESLTDLFSHQIRSKDVKLWIIFSPDVITPLKGDATRLKQILINVVNHFVNLCNSGHFFISTEVINKTGLKVALKTTVEIASEQAFASEALNTQQKLKTLTDNGRLGFQSHLSLNLCLRLIDLLGGEIEFSQPTPKRMKCEFILRFNCDAAQQYTYQNQLLKLLRVIVISTNEFTFNYFKQALSPYGINVEWLDSNTIKQNITFTPYSKTPAFIIDEEETSLLLCADLIKEHEIILGKSVLILLDSFSRAESKGKPPKELAKFTNKSYFFELPAKQSRLIEIFSEIVKSNERLLVDELPEENDLSLKGKRILVVDDSLLNLELMLELLDDWQAFSATAGNGKEALERLTLDSKFDCILMDLQMPIMGGLEATRQIKNDLKLAHIPIIAVAANTKQDCKNDCLALGMAAVLFKPISAPLLKKTIDNALKETDCIPISSIQISSIQIDKDSKTSDILNSAPPLVQPYNDVFNPIKALELAAGKKELLDKILVMFCRKYQYASQLIATSLHQNDFKSAKRIAHSVKGCAATISASNVEHLSEKIENAIAENNAIDEIQLQINELNVELQKLCASIEDFVREDSKQKP